MSKLYDQAIRSQEAVNRWNARYPVGCTVIVNRDDGSRVRTCTESTAWILPSGHAVIRLAGISGGGYLLSRVEPDGNDVPKRAIDQISKWIFRAKVLRRRARAADAIEDIVTLRREAQTLMRCARELRAIIVANPSD